MKITIRSRLNPTVDIDITRCLISAVAYELWERFGGNEQLNWLESERRVTQLMGGEPASSTQLENSDEYPECMIESSSTAEQLDHIADSVRVTRRRLKVCGVPMEDQVG